MAGWWRTGLVEKMYKEDRDVYVRVPGPGGHYGYAWIAEGPGWRVIVRTGVLGPREKRVKRRTKAGVTVHTYYYVRLKTPWRSIIVHKLRMKCVRPPEKVQLRWVVWRGRDPPAEARGLLRERARCR